MPTPMTWTALGVAGFVGAGVAVWYNVEKEKRQTAATKKQSTYGKPALGGSWTLVDAKTGQPVTDATYHGAYTLLYFGFARCPDICPAELVKVGEVVSLLETRKGPTVRPLFISLDPNRDSLQQLKYYAQDFHPSIDFLVGTPQQVKNAAKCYRVYSSIADGDEDDYLIDHSIVLYLNSPDGEFLDFFTQSTSARNVVDGILAHDKRRMRDN